MIVVCKYFHIEIYIYHIYLVYHIIVLVGLAMRDAFNYYVPFFFVCGVMYGCQQMMLVWLLLVNVFFFFFLQLYS